MIIEISERALSVNSVYAHTGKRRYMTPRGKEFKEFVEGWFEALIYEKKITPFTDERLKVEYEFHFKGKRKRDASNYVKVIEDCMSGILFDDDEQVDYFTVRRFYNTTHDFILIKLEENKP